MPNPNDPDEAECKYCHDSGELPGTYQPCHHCRGVPITTEHGPDHVSWFGQGRYPKCACGHDPRDNTALAGHWAEHGFRVVDEHGVLVKHPITKEI